MPVKVCFSEWSKIFWRIYFGQNKSVFCFDDTLSLSSLTSQPFPLKTKIKLKIKRLDDRSILSVSQISNQSFSFSSSGLGVKKGSGGTKSGQFAKTKPSFKFAPGSSQEGEGGQIAGLRTAGYQPPVSLGKGFGDWEKHTRGIGAKILLQVNHFIFCFTHSFCFVPWFLSYLLHNVQNTLEVWVSYVTLDICLKISLFGWM